MRLLNAPENAVHAGLGDLAMVQWNSQIQSGAVHPALLRCEMSGKFAFNFASQTNASKQVGLFTAQRLKSGILGWGIRTSQTGSIPSINEWGQYLGTYKVSEYQLKVYYAKYFADSLFSIGLGKHVLWSQYESYRSLASSIEMGVMVHLKPETHLSLVLKNAAWYWYSDVSTGAMPFTSQLGISHKLSKAPFRLMLVYEGLEQFNRLTPSNTGSANITSIESTAIDSTDWQKFSVRSGKTLRKITNHLQLGTEMIFSERFQLFFSYRFRNAQEQKLERAFSLTGLNLGFTLQTKNFGFSYAYRNLSVPLSNHFFTCTWRLKSKYYK